MKNHQRTFAQALTLILASSVLGYLVVFGAIALDALVFLPWRSKEQGLELQMGAFAAASIGAMVATLVGLVVLVLGRHKK
ncbi:MAG: hypothetical protein EXR98_12920 [Gemmataceae bacterium]|nr:hypothetical protein [Gemmataceae bacterium]